MIAASTVKICSRKKRKANGPSELEKILLGYYIRLRPRNQESGIYLGTQRLRRGKQVNRNFAIKSFLSQNWGACVYTKIWEEKNAGTQSFQDCIIKGSIRCESISSGFDAVSKIGYFIDDISR